MRSKSAQRAFIILMLGLFTVSAFFIRLDNFKQSQKRTIDEIVFYRMAEQVHNDGLSGYHTIPYGEELSEKGRPLPTYFSQPLFKHPPLFTFLLAASMKIFGVHFLSAGYIPIVLSALMIPLIYLLGAHVYDKRVGILAAVFLWIDPISIISSQKVWMDSTIAFFTLLAALFFVLGLKRNNDWWFIFSGLASGFAVNTKYTGIFITFIIAIYCLFYRRDIFANRKFQLSLLLPPILLAPWLFWNYQVYGIASTFKHREIQSLFTKLTAYMPIIAALIAVGLVAAYIMSRSKKDPSSKGQLIEEGAGLGFVGLSILVPVIFFAAIIPTQFLHSLQFNYLPTHSWQQGIFSGESAAFYFGRLIEFSPLYIFSFVNILLYHPSEKNETPFIRLSAMIILLFFIFWGNFQSRYILSSLPFLLLLGSQWIENFYHRSSTSNKAVIYFGGRILTWAVLVFIIAKVCYINFMISFPNDMCYF